MTSTGQYRRFGRPPPLYDDSPDVESLVEPEMFEIIPLQLIDAREADSGRPIYEVDGEKLTVECAALRRLQQDGFTGVFSGNETWWRITFFLFWDHIFFPLDEACDARLGEFPSQSQDIPRDLFTSAFYQRRCAHFENRHQKLEHKGVVSDLRSAIERHRTSPCRIVRGTDDDSVAAMLFAAERLPPASLLAICRRLLTDFAEYRRGMPDLFLFRDGQARFAEVKSTRDRLSEEQRNWLGWLERTAKVATALVVVNHSDRQLARLAEPSTPRGQPITIRFGKSSSKYYDEALSVAEAIPTYKEVDGHPSLRHEVTINTGDVALLFKMIDYVYRWKETEISSQGETLSAADLRSSLRCFHDKCEAGTGSSWCTKTHSDEKNLFGCRQIEMELFDPGERSWTEYGYIDSSTGEFVVRGDRIREEVMPQIEHVKLCPIFKEKIALNSLDNLPDRVKPGDTEGWAYEIDYRKWMPSAKGGWISTCGWRDFPGADAATGAAQYTSKELRDAEASWREREQADRRLEREFAKLEREANRGGRTSRQGCVVIPFLMLSALVLALSAF